MKIEAMSNLPSKKNLNEKLQMNDPSNSTNELKESFYDVEIPSASKFIALNSQRNLK